MLCMPVVEPAGYNVRYRCYRTFVVRPLDCLVEREIIKPRTVRRFEVNKLKDVLTLVRRAALMFALAKSSMAPSSLLRDLPEFGSSSR